MFSNIPQLYVASGSHLSHSVHFLSFHQQIYLGIGQVPSILLAEELSHTLFYGGVCFFLTALPPVIKIHASAVH